MNTDDPRLTAYALGELDPPEQAELEALLQADPEAAREVDEIRATAAHFRTHLAIEPAPALSPEQQRNVLAVASRPAAQKDADDRKVVPISKGRRAWVPLAIAACAAIVAGAGLKYYGQRQARFVTADVDDRSSVQKLAPREGVRERDAEAWPVATATPATPFSSADQMTLNKSAAPAAHPFTSASELKPKAEAGKDGDASGAPLLAQSQTIANAIRIPAGQAGGGAADPSSFAIHPIAPDAPAPMAPSAAPTASPVRAGDIVVAGVTAPGEASAALTKSGSGTLTLSGTNSYSGATTVTSGALTVQEPVGRAKANRSAGSSDLLPRAPQPQLKLATRDLAEAVPATTRAFRGTLASDEKTAGARIDSDRADKSKFLKDAPAPPTAGPAPAKPATTSLGLAVTGSGLLGQNSDGSSAKPAEAPAVALPEPEPAFNFNKEQSNTDAYDFITDNPFLDVLGNPLSTFSIDVDTASYSNVRRYLTAGERPPKGAVRIEELMNYFHYDYPQPKAGEPFSVNMEVAACPWTPEHRLLRIGIKARELDPETRPQANLVFLIDVSGSMMPENRLPLVKQSLRLLVDQLGPQDTVAIAVYAGASGTVLEPTNDKEKIRAALDRLQAGGSTNGAAGIRLAYDLAKKRFDKARTNRVILATDGDFNVGVTNQSDLIDLIKAKAKSGVYLTVLGVGYGNLKDSTMEKLADRGNGNYAYLDSIAEGRKVLVEQMSGTLFTVAKDVKMQIEFNPAQVSGYRLIGYEKRLLAKEDFNDDTKDAGEIGAGHTVTALYEVVPAGLPIPGAQQMTSVDTLKYQPAAPAPAAALAAAASAPAEEIETPRYAAKIARNEPAPVLQPTGKAPNGEMLTLKLRWKAPDGDVSTKREFPLTDNGLAWEKSSRDFRWAASVASFGMLLRDSPSKGQANWAMTRELAVEGQGEKADAHRIEFLELIGKAEALAQ